MEKESGCDGSCDAVDAIDSIAMLSFTVEDMSIGTAGLLKNELTKTCAVHEGSEANIYRLRDEGNNYGGRTGWVALKFLSEQFPDPDQISRLGNEYNILRRYLSECDSARAALKQEEADGCCAIYLEWIEGMTIRKWIQMRFANDSDAATPSTHNHETLIFAIRIAWAIAAGISEVHRSSVVHNNISAENIILCKPLKSTLGASVKIIDFGNARPIGEDNADSTSDTKIDLLALGALFYEMFSGVSPFQTSTASSHCTSSCSGILPFSTLNSLITAKVPPSVAELVFKMMRLRPNAQYYSSAGEVCQDLHFLLDDPDQLMLSAESYANMHRLNFTEGKLYGRANEVSIIESAYERVIQSNGVSEIVIVRGYSGTGKTALVKEACKPLVHQCGYFISGKFDQLKQTEPLSAFISAFTQYCDEIIQGDPEILSQVRSAVEEAIGTEGSFLTTLVPKLNQIITLQSPHTFQVAGVEAQYQFNFVLRNFIKAMASSTRPVILFLDDLQWADDASLDLIKILFTDKDIKHVLFIASYRNDIVDDDHPLGIRLHQIDRSNVTVTKIPVSNIAIYDVNELISDSLCMPQALTQPLADIVCHKTCGNVLFVIEFLKSLYGDGLLYFSFDNNCWEWDAQVIEAKEIASNALELMLLKIKFLPAETQNALLLVACLGSCFDDSLLRLIMIDNEKIQNNSNQENSNTNAYHEYNYLVRSLNIAVNEGLMDKKEGSFKFAHDQIQLAAYSLIEQSRRGILHLKIGNLFLRNKSAAIDKALFIMVDQLNLGAKFITDELKREELAWLCLKASQKAFSSSAFWAAAAYLEAGMGNLVQKHWEEQYELSLELYNHYAQIQFCTANFEKMGKVSNEILAHAESFEDKLATYSVLVSALGAQSKVEQAMEIGFDVLKDLGESFPTKTPNEAIIFLAFGETKYLLGKRSCADLLALNKMNHRQKCHAMKFLDQMLLYSYSAKQELIPLIAFRMVNLTLRYGICKESAFGFASYGFLLCSAFGDVDGGYSYGQFALQLLEKLQNYECLPRIYAAVHGCINIWSKNIQLCLEPHMMAFKVGMRSGDTEYAIVNGLSFLRTAFQAGNDLDMLDEMCIKISQQAKEVKQGLLHRFILLTWHTVLNFKNVSDDPMRLTGGALEEEDLFRNLAKSSISLLRCFFFWHRMILAYMFGDYTLAADMADKAREIEILSRSTFEMCSFVFYDCLISLALAFQTKETKWIDLAKDDMRKMKAFSLHAPCNCQHKLDLMEAEYAVLTGDYDKAAAMYDISIAGAVENGFKHEEALGYERAATFYLWQGKTSKSSPYYGRAHNAYLEWGAKAKADILRLNYPF